MNYRRIVAILWTIAVVGFHAIPRRQLERLPGKQYTLVEGPDKLAHIGLFGLFSALWLLAYPKRPWLILFAGLIFGVALELMQHFFIRGRSGNMLDFAYDTGGLFIGLAIAAGFNAWKARRSGSAAPLRPL